MRSHELRPTYENLRDCLLKDSIGRNEDLFAFVRILNGLEGSHAVALDGGWGSGKTFFVRQAKLLLDAGNEALFAPVGDAAEIEEKTQDEGGKEAKTHAKIKAQLEAKTQDEAKINALWAEHNPDVTLNSLVPVYYDAWANDCDDDPVLSLVYSITQSYVCSATIEKKDNVTSWTAKVADALKPLAELASGAFAAMGMPMVSGVLQLPTLLKALKQEDALQSVRDLRDIQQQIQMFFHALLENRGDRLVIFVDELDRCRPSFAVKLLERIKHYFDDDRITFVFSVNISELQCTVRKFYGEDFDACRYLDRFFTMRLPMPPVDMEKYLEQIGFEVSTHYAEAVERVFIRSYGLNMREIERYLRQCTDRLAPLLYSGKDSHRATPEDTGNEFALTFIFPILEGLYLFKKDVYDQVLAGKNSQPVVELLAQLPPDYFNILLDANESFSEVRATGTSGKRHIVLRDRLEEMYQAIFVKPFLPDALPWSICGQCQFGRSTYEFLQRLMSPLQQHVPDKDAPTEKAPALTP